MFIVSVLCILAFILMVKIWIAGVKFVGRTLKTWFKPVYKFLLKLCPVTVIICTLFLAIIIFSMVTSAISGSADNKEQNEVVEEKTEDEHSFNTAFMSRAERRMQGFANILIDNKESIYKLMGANEKGEFGELSVKSVLAIFLIFILLPFIVLLLIVILSILGLLEVFIITLLIDSVIFGIRCIRHKREIRDIITDWWLWARG